MRGGKAKERRGWRDRREEDTRRGCWTNTGFPFCNGAKRK